MSQEENINPEVKNLNEIVEKIIELKNQGNVDQAIALSYQTINGEFDITKEYLETKSTEEFNTLVKSKNHSPEKLNLLASLLFESVYPFTENEETAQVLHKTALILNQLELEYQQQSFENLHRREQIDNFLSNLQYE